VGSVTSIDPAQDLQTFLEFIFGNETGYVYSPTKNPDPENPVFKQYFFHWPTGKEQLIQHIQVQSQTHEVYFGPALYKDATDAEKESFKGTNVVWVEFDGTDPSGLSDVPEPNLKIRSSTDKHEHWYWKLDRFIEDISTLEIITQRLAYHLSADLGCWNANRVLRPPSTRHHESGLTVTTFRWDPQPTAIHLFNGLPEVPVKLLHETDINFIPEPLKVIAKYAWADRPDDFDFFMEPKIEQGHRSSALAKLGHICIELGMTNAETLSLLLNADSRWGKFSKRRDQKARLLGIINYCRSRHPVDPVSGELETKTEQEDLRPRLKVYTYEEFINTKINLEWVVEGLIHKKGLAMLSGPPDVGKSQLSIRFAQKLAIGEPFLKWAVPRPMRTLLVSMEMPHEELHYLLEGMQFKENELLSENMLVLPLGYSIRLANKAAQAEIAAVVEEFKPDGIIFDSFGVGIGDDLNSEKIILDALDFVHKTLRGAFGCFVWFIHHNRKAQIGNKKPNKLDDMFGSQYIGAAITTGMGLWPTKPGGPIEFNCLKLRMAKKFDTFHIRRMTNLDFEIYTGETIPDGKIVIPSGINDRFSL
jgi:hypothetical protein